ncbi:helix-turn-helix domain-containing protein [Komagataeibacter sp. FNDCF1]|uniref:helix-turn-helix domain-containing protein n=1 Tax=Komagataeibacter sp. FNDCF1 TaxID=2878681 RepID=UPI001E40CB43|nr:helix-turn-helix domain-containing protein [Komagataeibacter sp. FNDCF1]MCE2563859.1 DUF4115 domain-containing protein [Komagataeibacter sp. FNDCF1]
MTDGKRVFRPKSAPGTTAPAPGTTPIASVGDILRARREELGWNLPDVAAWLRIRLPYLEALESGHAAELPGSAYAIGFLRTYAKALGLESEPLAERFKTETRGAFTRRTELSFPMPLPERGLPTGVLLLCGIVILVGAYIGWYRLSSSGGAPDIPTRLTLPGLSSSTTTASPQVASMLPPAEERPAPQPLPPQEREALTGVPATTPAPQPSSPPMPAAPSQPLEKMGEDRNLLTQPSAAAQSPAAAAATTDAVTLNATAATWVQVRKTGGPVLYDHVLQPGETWQAPADQTGLVLTVGNAGGLTLSTGSVTTQPLGRNGEVRRNIPLNPAAVADGSVMHAPAPVQNIHPAMPSTTAETAPADMTTTGNGNNLSPPLPQHINPE